MKSLLKSDNFNPDINKSKHNLEIYNLQQFRIGRVIDIPLFFKRI